MRVFSLCAVAFAFFQPVQSDAASVMCRDGSIHYSDAAGRSIRLTDPGRDRELALHPGGQWVYSVRTYEGVFRDEKYFPPPGKTAPQGTMLQEALSRVSTSGAGARMLCRHDAAGPSPSADHEVAWISNIQFSPDGARVYFEASRWATSSELHVMDADGSGRRALGPGNGTRIIRSSRGDEYRGHIVTRLHRYHAFGGSYDWYYLFTRYIDKDVGPLGESLDVAVAAGDVTLMPTGQIETKNENPRCPPRQDIPACSGWRIVTGSHARIQPVPEGSAPRQVTH